MLLIVCFNSKCVVGRTAIVPENHFDTFSVHSNDVVIPHIYLYIYTSKYILLIENSKLNRIPISALDDQTVGD